MSTSDKNCPQILYVKETLDLSGGMACLRMKKRDENLAYEAARAALTAGMQVVCVTMIDILDVARK